jgi:Ca2+-binding EF-hand superfamily protein
MKREKYDVEFVKGLSKCMGIRHDEFEAVSVVSGSVIAQTQVKVVGQSLEQISKLLASSKLRFRGPKLKDIPFDVPQVTLAVTRMERKSVGKMPWNSRFMFPEAHIHINGADEPINWARCAELWPTGRDDIAKSARRRIWKTMDANGNGLMSLAELDRGAKLMGWDPYIKSKKVMMRAFQAAKVVGLTLGNRKDHADYVSFKEFRVLLQYLRQYLELFVMFAKIDADGDGRIEKKEFSKAVHLLCEWGMKEQDKDSQEAIVDSIECDGGGMILFDEFADWALRQQLDLADDDDAEDAGKGSGVIRRRHHGFDSGS